MQYDTGMANAVFTLRRLIAGFSWKCHHILILTHDFLEVLNTEIDWKTGMNPVFIKFVNVP